MDTIGGGTYWFTGALAVAELLVLALLLTRNRNVWFYALLSIALAWVGLWLKESHITFCGSSSLPWFYKEGLTFLPYMAIGGVFWRYERQLEEMRKMPVLALLIALCLASLLLPSYSGALELIINLTRCSMFAACFVQICKRLPRISILTFLGQKSIAFYYVSGAIPNVLALLLRRVYSGDSVVVMLGMFGGALVLSIVAVWLLNRYLPFLFDLRSLSKNRHN